jgi:calcium binding protein 39
MTSFLNSIPKKVKTSEELIISTKKALNSILLNTWDDENDKLVVERSLTKNINDVKVILCGDAEHHDADDEKIREVCKYIQNEDIVLLFIDKIDMLLFDVRKDFTFIFINLIRRNLNNFVGYILENSNTIKRLTEGYVHADSAFSCGLMLRECIRHELLAKYLLSSDLVWHFFDSYVHLPNFDVASDAFNTLKELLTTPKNKQISVEFLDLYYDKFLEKYEVKNNCFFSVELVL